MFGVECYLFRDKQKEDIHKTKKTFPVHNSLNGECHYNYEQI